MIYVKFLGTGMDAHSNSHRRRELPWEFGANETNTIFISGAHATNIGTDKNHIYHISMKIGPKRYSLQVDRELSSASPNINIGVNNIAGTFSKTGWDLTKLKENLGESVYIPPELAKKGLINIDQDMTWESFSRGWWTMQGVLTKLISSNRGLAHENLKVKAIEPTSGYSYLARAATGEPTILPSQHKNITYDLIFRMGGFGIHHSIPFLRQDTNLIEEAKNRDDVQVFRTPRKSHFGQELKDQTDPNRFLVQIQKHEEIFEEDNLLFTESVLATIALIISPAIHMVQKSPNRLTKYLSSLLRDKNYKKYAIKKPKNINEILVIDSWARTTILKKVKNK